jgi:hypothetical protein
MAALHHETAHLLPLRGSSIVAAFLDALQNSASRSSILSWRITHAGILLDSPFADRRA